jgi:hypothetical protein
VLHVRDANGQALAFVYCEDEPGGSPTAKSADPRRGAALSGRGAAAKNTDRVYRHAASHREAREMGLLASSTHAFRSCGSKALSASAGNFLYCTSASAHFHR